MAQWYYSDDQRNRLGPVGDADMAGLHAGGQLAPETLVWREGLAQWQPWRSLMHEVVASASPAMAAAGPAAAPRHGYNPYAVAEPDSPYAPPRAPVQRAAEIHLDGHVVYAGFWKRVAAYFIDAVILAVLGGMTGALIGGLMGATQGFATSSLLAIQTVTQIGGLLVAACYYGFFYASSNQATPGKMAIGIKVVRSDGSGCSFWRGFGRHFATLLSALLLLVGYLMVAFTARKQALHDMVCDTVVVDRWAFTAHADQQREELGALTWVVLAVAGLLLAGLALAFIGLVASFAAH
ncbi:MAG TPA: RDD family protein [Luteimonas sp.]|nr:RDD family protein [Luteimonas sp.]